MPLKSGFAKNDRLDSLIVLARDEGFLFFHLKLDDGFTFSPWMKHYNVFYFLPSLAQAPSKLG